MAQPGQEGQTTHDISMHPEWLRTSQPNELGPRGRWAMRARQEPLVLKSDLDKSGIKLSVDDLFACICLVFDIKLVGAEFH